MVQNVTIYYYDTNAVITYGHPSQIYPQRVPDAMMRKQFICLLRISRVSLHLAAQEEECTNDKSKGFQQRDNITGESQGN